MVLDAIVNDRFWILTHSAWYDVLQERVAAMARDGSLHAGFGG